MAVGSGSDEWKMHTNRDEVNVGFAGRLELGKVSEVSRDDMSGCAGFKVVLYTSTVLAHQLTILLHAVGEGREELSITPSSSSSSSSSSPPPSSSSVRCCCFTSAFPRSNPPGAALTTSWKVTSSDGLMNTSQPSRMLRFFVGTLFELADIGTANKALSEAGAAEPSFFCSDSLVVGGGEESALLVCVCV